MSADSAFILRTTLAYGVVGTATATLLLCHDDYGFLAMLCGITGVVAITFFIAESLRLIVYAIAERWPFSRSPRQ